MMKMMINTVDKRLVWCPSQEKNSCFPFLSSMDVVKSNKMITGTFRKDAIEWTWAYQYVILIKRRRISVKSLLHIRGQSMSVYTSIHLWY
jgi:hypothetical protein